MRASIASYSVSFSANQHTSGEQHVTRIAFRPMIHNSGTISVAVSITLPTVAVFSVPSSQLLWLPRMTITIRGCLECLCFYVPFG